DLVATNLNLHFYGRNAVRTPFGDFMKKTTDLRITPKRLGLILVAAFCARCFWYQLHLLFKQPFSFFGGAIFKNMEQAEMAIIGAFLEKDGKLPKEFAPFCDVVGRVEYPRH